MISKPKHLTWENLSEIYKKELIDKPIYYTWKADGYLTKITFNSNKMFLKIYNKERTILTQEIENIDLSTLNSIINYQNLGYSVLELSHRSKIFQDILNSTKSYLQKILNIPENFEIIFLQGGATFQNTIIAANKPKLMTDLTFTKWHLGCKNSQRFPRLL